MSPEGYLKGKTMKTLILSLALIAVASAAESETKGDVAPATTETTVESPPPSGGPPPPLTQEQLIHWQAKALEIVTIQVGAFESEAVAMGKFNAALKQAETDRTAALAAVAVQRAAASRLAATLNEWWTELRGEKDFALTLDGTWQRIKRQ